MVLKWGICCAGHISHDFANSFATLQDGNNIIMAVAAQNLERSQQFAAKFKIPHALGSYKELAESADIDVVYIGAINTQHLELTCMFLQHKKHVLCEKPFGLHSEEVQKMIKTAKENNRFVMEAVWSRFFPAYDFIRQEIAKGSIGDVKHVTCNFHVPLGLEGRVADPKQGGGGLLDIGIYCLNFALWVLPEDPIKITPAGVLLTNGVDETSNITLEYPDHRTAYLSYHIDCQGSTAAAVYGTRGSIELRENFWCPTEVWLNGTRHEFPVRSTEIPFNFTNSAALAHEVEHVRACIEAGKLESDVMPLSESLRLIRMMENILKTMGAHAYRD